MSCTGKGEIFIQHVAAHSVASRMSLAGKSLAEASKEVVHTVLPANSGGLIAVDSNGGIAMEFNTRGMLRLSCDQTGEGSVAIWEESVPVTISR